MKILSTGPNVELSKVIIYNHEDRIIVDLNIKNGELKKYDVLKNICIGKYYGNFNSKNC